MASDTLHIFGSGSILHAQPLPGAQEVLLNSNSIEGWIGFALLVLFFISLPLIYRFFSQSKAEMLHVHITLKHFENHSLVSKYLRQLLALFGTSIIAFLLLLIIRNTGYTIISTGVLETYILLLATLVIFYVVKISILLLLGHFSATAAATQLLVYYFQLHLITGSLLIFPLLLFLFNLQGSWFIILKTAFIIICFSAFLSYIIRCWQIFRVAGVSVFFRILYLCTLEFVPFLIIYKYISLG